MMRVVLCDVYVEYACEFANVYVEYVCELTNWKASEVV